MVMMAMMLTRSIYQPEASCELFNCFIEQVKRVFFAGKLNLLHHQPSPPMD